MRLFLLFVIFFGVFFVFSYNDNQGYSQTPQTDLVTYIIDNYDPTQNNGMYSLTAVVQHHSSQSALNAENVEMGIFLPVEVIGSGATLNTNLSCTPFLTGNIIVSNSFTCNVGTLLLGSKAELTINIVSSPISDATVTSSVSVSTTTPEISTSNNIDGEATTFVPVVADIELTTTADPWTVTSGDDVTFHITLENSFNTAENVIVETTLSSELDFVSGTSPNGCIYDSNSRKVTCNIGDVLPGINGKVIPTITVNVNKPLGGWISPQFIASTTTPDANAQNSKNGAVVTVLPDTEADLELTITESIDPVLSGNQLTYTIDITNHGPDTARNTILHNFLESSVMYDNLSSDTRCSFFSEQVTCDLGDIPASNSDQIVIVVDVIGLGGYIDHISTVVSDDDDPIGSNNNYISESTTITPLSTADLSLSMTTSESVVSPDQIFDYNIVVTNNGPDDAEGVQVIDTLPGGISVQQTTPNDCIITATTVTCDLGIISSSPPNNSDTVTITVLVDSDTAGILTNNAYTQSNSYDNKNNNNGDTRSITSLGSDVQLDVTVSNTIFSQTQNVEFDITVTNNGPRNADDVALFFSYNDGLTLDTNTIPSQCNTFSNSIECNLGPITNGNSQNFMLAATVSNDSGVVTNDFHISGDSPDHILSNNFATKQIIIGNPDVDVSNVIDNERPLIGDSIMLQISAVNNGNVDATGLLISDIPHVGLSYQSDTSNGSYDHVTGIWNVGDLAVGELKTIDIISEITSDITCGAIIKSTEIASIDQIDLDSSNDSEREFVFISDVSLQKSVDNSTPKEGDVIVYRIEAPFGCLPAEFEVTDILPSGVSYISDNSFGKYDPVTGIWSADVDLTNVLEIIAKIDDGTKHQVITNDAILTGGIDNNPDNNFASVDITIDPIADLSLDISVDNPNPIVGDTITITLTETNNGPNISGVSSSRIHVPDVNNIHSSNDKFLDSVSIQLDPGVHYNAEDFVWGTNGLAPGESKSMTITGVVTTSESLPHAFTVKSRITSAAFPDPDSTPGKINNPLEDDEAAATITVFPLGIDSDGDGIDDSVDPLPNDPTNNDFTDGISSGVILTGKQFLSISDAPGSEIRIQVSGPASVSACGLATITFTSGQVKIICHSITLEMISGSANVEFVSDDRITDVVLSSGDTVTFDNKTATLTNHGDTSIEVNMDENIFSIEPNQTHVVPEFSLSMVFILSIIVMTAVILTKTKQFHINRI